ncbi:MAG: arsenate reductase ArsC [Alphaproteobacteria bacterium]|nr:arsenate reductase ArsC [Alphaproteobacteria bacterium]
MGRAPASVLFACSRNAIRSPIAEAIAKHLLARRVFVDSAGVRPGPLDPFAVAVLEEIGIDLQRHRPKSFDDLQDGSFDLIVSLSPEAHHKAMEMTRTSACEVEYWPTPDPSAVEGGRETVLEGYRALRDQLMAKIKRRFDMSGGPTV